MFFWVKQLKKNIFLDISVFTPFHTMYSISPVTKSHLRTGTPQQLRVLVQYPYLGTRSQELRIHEGRRWLQHQHTIVQDLPRYFCTITICIVDVAQFVRFGFLKFPKPTLTGSGQKTNSMKILFG